MYVVLEYFTKCSYLTPQRFFIRRFITDKVKKKKLQY